MSQHARTVATVTKLGLGEALASQREFDAINLRPRDRKVDLARVLAGGLPASGSVRVLGATFKPDSDSIQDGPALAMARAVHGQAS